ncbi:MAG: hypothetical protein L0Y50_05835, partial [Beijerinckiaceae bacterium]|nr:hypothetical protein [Beijerinckiaceae bacterium]
MNIRKAKYAFAALTLGALAAYSVPASAQDAVAEIRLLKERLKQLEAKVAKQEKERKEAEARVHQFG